MWGKKITLLYMQSYNPARHPWVHFLKISCSQDGGLFQRSNRRDVDLLSKQNTSTYTNNSKNHTVTDITSFFNFVFFLSLLSP